MAIMESINPRRRLEAEIRRFSHAMMGLLAAAAGLYPVALAVYVFGGGALVLAHPWMANQHVSRAALTPTVSAVFFLTLALAAAPLVWGLWRLSRMFAGLAAEPLFSLDAGREFGRFAWALVATAVAEPAASIVFGLALHLAGVVRTPAIVLSASSTQLVTLLLGLVLTGVAKMMRMAAYLAQENAEYV
jgi:hypothetical protein